MRRFHFIVAAVAALLMACIQSSANPRIVVGSDPDADQVRTVAQNFYLKIAAVDKAGAKALFAGPPEHEAILDAQLHFVGAAEKCIETLKKRFGEAGMSDRDSVGDMFRAWAAKQPKHPMILNGNFACLSGGSG